MPLTQTFTEETTYQPMVCGKCGIQFALTERTYKERRKDHGDFYCPNGCCRAYLGQTTEEKLRQQLAQERDNKYGLQHSLERANRSRAALRGQVTKIKRRVGRGICPCCNHTFKDLGDHMESKHPDWTEGGET